MLAVAGGKGGVGKTTTAIGLAVALVRRRRNPVLVDADADMPNVHLVTGVDGDGVDRLAAGAALGAATETADQFDGIEVLGARPGAPVERALRGMVTDRPVILDSPAGASPDAVLPLRMADEAIVVTTPEPEAVQDAVKSARIARSVGTTVVAWVVNRTGRVSESVRQAAGDVPVIPVPSTDSPPFDARGPFDEALTCWVNA
ncbi:MAG: MinD/ParA family protein [Halanaeroarchaeum sp.]